MYHEFYDLTTDPFRLSPDHRFCFGHRSFKRARTYMEYALDRGEGFVMVTGEPGTGKSTLIEDLFAGLQGQPVVKAKLVSTQLYAEDLLRMVAFSYGIKAEGDDKATLLKKLTDYFVRQRQSNRRVLLVVDEAQDLPSIALEELRLLTNLQENSVPLLQIFLVGQQELRDKIHGRDMEQVHQRIVAACHLEPLKLNETRGYVEHRLHCAGWVGDPCISDAAFYLIQHFSAGIPRRINLICSRVFLHGSVEELHKFSAKDVRIVLQELHQERLISRGGLTKQVLEMLADVPPAIEDDCTPTVIDEPAADAAGQTATAAPLRQADDNTGAPPQVSEDRPVAAHEADDNNTHATPGSSAQAESATAAAVGEPDTVAGDTTVSNHEVAVAGEEQKTHWLGTTLISLAVLTLIGFLVYQVKPGPWNDLWESLRDSTEKPSENIGNVASAPPDSTNQTGETDGVTNVPASDQPEAEGVGPAQPGTTQEPQRDEAGGVAANDMSPAQAAPPEEADAAPSEQSTLEAVSRQPTDPDLAEGQNDAPQVIPVPDAEEREDAAAAAVESDMERPLRQMKEIEQALVEMNLPVIRTDEGSIEVNLRNAVPFESGSAEISMNSREVLDRIAEVLGPHDAIALRIVGHTDRSGDEAYNLYLSESRAAAVANYLKQEAGANIPLSVEGRGSTDPVVPHDSANRRLNRRTVLYIDQVHDG